MSGNTELAALNGHQHGSGSTKPGRECKAEDLEKLNFALREGLLKAGKSSQLVVHGDPLLLEERPKKGSYIKDIVVILSMPYTWWLVGKTLVTLKFNPKDLARIVSALETYSPIRAVFLQGNGFLMKKGQVEQKWSSMLHPPLSYLGGAFQHRTVDGSFNSVLHPHLGQAGAPYAKTVPAKARLLGAQPDPGDVFDRLMARETSGARKSGSGLSMMLIYHATIIIHDIFRTNEKDKNISDTSSYLDLSPLYGYDEATCNKVRTRSFGLLHPDTFAENRLLRQPPGVCIYLIMYNRYHNYVARQLYRINENGRFSIPDRFKGSENLCVQRFQDYYWELKNFAHKYVQNSMPNIDRVKLDSTDLKVDLAVAKRAQLDTIMRNEVIEFEASIKDSPTEKERFAKWKSDQPDISIKSSTESKTPSKLVNVRLYDGIVAKFKKDREAALAKLDNDLFGTARLITCGLYVNISVHDYLRALMGLHQWNTSFTLDPRLEVDKKLGKEGLARGIGNQVSVEFNLLYRFHCAIGEGDEAWMNNMIRIGYGMKLLELKEAKDEEGNLIKSEEGIMKNWDPTTLTSEQFTRVNLLLQKKSRAEMTANPSKADPQNQTFFDLNQRPLPRDEITKQFDDNTLIEILKTKMDEPIAQFGPKNVPRALRSVEIAGILQARKWEIGTLNDFREFFGMKRHENFESVSRDPELARALRELYEDVDKIEFYPGIFCEGGPAESPRDCDPGPQIADSTLWAAIFSDAVTLVRSDRFYTVDWNTHTLTSWGMKEVSADYDNFKSSLFHRLLQRAFPDWYKADSLRFFSPFYTTETNMKYAKSQGYGEAFKIPDFSENNERQVKESLAEVRKKSDPKKPNPTYKLTPTLKREHMPENVTIVIKSRAAAEDIIRTRAKTFVNPAWLDPYSIPDEIRNVLRISKAGATVTDLAIDIMGSEREGIAAYFEELATRIINQRRQKFDEGNSKRAATYQIDAVRDYVIPVMTQYFADFLGFSHLVIRENVKGGKYSPNEIYHHIVNVQNHLSFNVDETKRWKRREAFKKSIKFLLDLSKDGHIKASSWWLFGGSTKSGDQPYMKELGYKVAQKILKNKNVAKTSDEAAAIMLLAAIDSVYNVVLTFTASLAFFFKQTNRTFKWKFMDIEEKNLQEALHAKIKAEHETRSTNSSPDTDHYAALESHERQKIIHGEGLITWEQIQSMVFKDGVTELDKEHEIMHYVLEAQRLTVKLPILQRVVTDTPFKVKGSDFEFHDGDTVIIDVHAAEGIRHKYCQKEFCIEQMHTHKDLDAYLAYVGGFSHEILKTDIKNIPVIGMSVLFKVLGRMKMLRQGHDSQGRLKYLKINHSYNNLGERIMPRDLNIKLAQIREGINKRNEANKNDPEYIFESFDTKPESYSYLTPEWDETMPFPNTMKVRFNGFGQGVWIYGDNSDQHHGIDSLWSLDTLSSVGGVWASKSCACELPGCKCATDVKESLKRLHEHIHTPTDGYAESRNKAQGTSAQNLGTPYSGCGL